MHKRFELWLDESGQFKNEGILKQDGKLPSLVGGILISKSAVKNINFGQLIDAEHNHAMNLDDSGKVDFVLPVLETLQKAGAQEVFFENLEYIDKESSRELYLQILSEGIIRLVARLDAEFESISLEVYIAQRQDMEALTPEMRRINEREYRREIQHRIDMKRQLNRVYFNNNTSISFVIFPAHRSKKIQCADFACNTRLTRNSKAFEGNEGRILALHEDAICFSMRERPTINRVQQRLTQDNISGAILELYTSYEKIGCTERAKIARLIVDRMQHLSYRMLKSQLKQCSSDIVAYGQSQSDYEVAEQTLLAINADIISLMKKAQLPYEGFAFSILLWLSDALLREGDIIEARKVINDLVALEKRMGNSLEQLLNYYQTLEKQALLCIDEFDYEHARNYMKTAEDLFTKAIWCVTEKSDVQERFPTLKSEYLGDALCMEIYAMMFMQRGNPDIYEEMCTLSDKALTQYPGYPGELQRHLQYRSHIELENGNYEAAVLYLFKSAEYMEDRIDGNTLNEFLNRVCDKEQSIGCQYYLMYYLLIMSEAALNGNELAKEMSDVLHNQGRLISYGEIRVETDSYFSEKIDTSSVSGKKSGILYHPMEIIQWKYATYQMVSNHFQQAEWYYVRAMAICNSCPKYVNMKIVSLGIAAERCYCMCRNGETKAAKKEVSRIILDARVLKKMKLTTETKRFIDLFIDKLKKVVTGNNSVDSEVLWQASRLITY